MEISQIFKFVYIRFNEFDGSLLLHFQSLLRIPDKLGRYVITFFILILYVVTLVFIFLSQFYYLGKSGSCDRHFIKIVLIRSREVDFSE